jgi:hypothetical protein
MKDKCPQCGFEFGLRSPKSEIQKGDKSSPKKIRYFCPSCSVELFYYKSKTERFLYIAGFLGMLIWSFNSILRMDFNYSFLPRLVEKGFNLLSIICLGGFILLSCLNQHYKMNDSSQPNNSANIKDHAAD